MLDPEDHVRAVESKPELLLSAGRPLVGTDLKVVDTEGNEMKCGEVGEVPGPWPAGHD